MTVLFRSLTRPSILAATLALPLAWGLTGCSDTATTAMPDVPMTQLDGQQLRTTDLKGKVMLVNFWATSCATCVKEMPDLMATHRQFAAQGLETVAVAMQYDPPAYVMQFTQTRGLPFRVVIDHDGQIASAFGPVQLTPTTFVVNREGRIVKRYIGEPDFAALHKLLQELLAQPVT